MFSDNSIRQLLAFGLAAVVLIVLTYPTSPVLFQILVFDHIIAFLILCGVGFPLALLLKNRKIRFRYKLHVSGSLLTSSLVVLTLIACFLITGNPTAIRDLMSLLLIGCVIYMLKNKAYIKFYRLLIRFTALLVLLSLPGVVMFALSPESFDIWRAANLDIKPDNPLLSREKWADFDYAMYFYTSVIPVDWSSDSQRYPLFFTEPTYYGAYVIAPLFLAVYDARSGRDWLVVAILFIGFLLSYSILVLLLVLASLMIGYLAINLRLGSPKLLFLLFMLAPLGLLVFPSIFFFLLDLLPGDKIAEFEFFLLRGAFSLPAEVSLFGTPAQERVLSIDAIEAYGATVLFTRYGLVGTFAFVLFLLMYVYRSFNFLYTPQIKKSKRLIGFTALFCCTCMAIKIPQFLLLSSILTYHYLICTSAQRSSTKPFKPAV